jgi:predicted ATP-grasp superfamily ATP-dependent carboligase
VKDVSEASRHRVFVTDGSYPNGLAAVRALSRSGYRVTVGERDTVPLTRTVSFWSRYCAERFRYPDPHVARDACAQALAEHLRQGSYSAAIPVGLEMVRLFADYRELLSVAVMLPPQQSFATAYDKRLTFSHAASLGIPIPQTVPAAQWAELSCPIVFKHPQTGTLVAHTSDMAARQFESLGDEAENYLAQEYIPGRNGFGYFGFFQHGHECAYFMHERLMQFPEEGGPSVVARAVRDTGLRDLGRSMLKSLSWHGVAMVEFKRGAHDNKLYLMEINPKLWGSLDLAIQAGCNFPVWIARTLIEGVTPAQPSYAEGLTYQWVIPNGLKSFLRYPEFRGRFIRNILNPNVRSDFQWLDPGPAAAGLVAMTVNMAT